MQKSSAPFLFSSALPISFASIGDFYRYYLIFRDGGT